MQLGRKVFHPLLFAAAPALSVFVEARDQLDYRELLWPVLGCEVAALLLWAGAALLFRDWSRGAVATSGSLILLFGFGYAAAAFPVDETLQLVVWALALCALWAVVARSSPHSEGMTRALNLAALAFLALPLLTLTLTSIARAKPALVVEHPMQSLPSDVERPDIYYIVLDGFGSATTLERVYDLDIQAFLGSLEELGFFVAARSRANYSQTQLSLASSLNLSYLDDLAHQLGAEETRRGALRALIQRSRLIETLEHLNYAVISFETGYSATELRHASRYLASGRALSEFEGQLVDLTPLPQLFPGFTWLNRHAQHRDRVSFTLDTLPELAAAPGPKFVFAHILSPHPPFVFDADGSATQPERRFSIRDGSHLDLSPGAYRRGYRDQVRYLSERLLASISALLENASKSPIIVIQGDHGPGVGLDHESLETTDVRERMSILNAIYLGGAAQDGLYAELSPVNTFRCILTRYLGQPYPRLPDRSYFSTWAHPYDFHDVTAVLAEGIDPGTRELANALQPGEDRSGVQP